MEIRKGLNDGRFDCLEIAFDIFSKIMKEDKPL
jgi:hypothetical protein